MNVKCLKDTEGYWTEGEKYPARVVAGGFVQVGDDVILPANSGHATK